jgi:hypothetical protein
MIVLYYVGLLLFARYLYKELKSLALARCNKEVREVRTEEDVRLYMDTASHHRKYVSRKLRASYPFLFPCSALAATLVFLNAGLYVHCPAELTETCPLSNQSVTCITAASTPLATATEPEAVVFKTRSCLGINTRDTYCHASRAWREPITGIHTHYHTNVDATRAHFIDTERNYYFVAHASELRPIDRDGEDETHIVTGPVLVKEQQLRMALAQQHEECVCAPAMGIHDNVSFVYDRATTQWAVLIDTAVVSPAPGARMIQRVVSYNRQRAVTLEHYDQLIVSFSSPQFKFTESELTTLIEHNRRTKNTTFILRRLNEPAQHLARLSVVLSGDSATCFTYCSRRHPSHLALHHHH